TDQPQPDHLLYVSRGPAPFPSLRNRRGTEVGDEPLKLLAPVLHILFLGAEEFAGERSGPPRLYHVRPDAEWSILRLGRIAACRLQPVGTPPGHRKELLQEFASRLLPLDRDADGENGSLVAADRAPCAQSVPGRREAEFAVTKIVETGRNVFNVEIGR